MIYTLDELRAIISPIAKRYRLKAVYVFGSYATGHAREDSDIDLLIDTAGTELSSLFALGALYCELADTLKKPIDLLTVCSLEQKCQMASDQIFRERVEKERMEIYAVA